MSLNRYGKARDTAERGIIEALEAQRCSVYQLDKPLDLLVGFEDKEGRRRTLVLEVKNPLGPRGGTGGSELSEGQEEFIREWRGDVVAVVRSPEEALALIGCETRGVEIGPRKFSSPWLDGGTE